MDPDLLIRILETHKMRVPQFVHKNYIKNGTIHKIDIDIQNELGFITVIFLMKDDEDKPCTMTYEYNMVTNEVVFIGWIC